MPKKIKIRDKYVITTHTFTNKTHYVLKSMAMTNVRMRLRTPAESLCKLVRVGRAAKVLIVTPHNSTVTCQSCLRALKKLEKAQVATQKLKVVKMLKTDDGKTFPFKAREAALKHADELNAVKKQEEFITTVEETLFTEGGVLNEDLIMEFEEDLTDALQYLGKINLEKFLKCLHMMLQKHGRRIRSMLILYQKIYGTLVPCRDTMEKMKDAGIYL